MSVGPYSGLQWMSVGPYSEVQWTSVGPYSGLQWMSVGPYIEVQWGTMEVSETEQQITEDNSGNQRIKTVKVICLLVVLCQTNKKSTVFIHSGKHVMKVTVCEVYSRIYNFLCRVVVCSSHNCILSKLIQICSQVVFTRIQYILVISRLIKY